MARGVLYLVVGPSGAGKDTLIDRAREARPDLLFPQRVVTRDAGAGGEEITAVTPERFTEMAGSGQFMLHWGAHGLFYGVPVAAAEALAAGRSVMINVSRGVVAEARARFAPVRVLLVTAAPEVLAARLSARGREDADDIRRRVAQAARGIPGGADAEIDNGGTVEEGVARFLSALSPVETG